MFPTVYTDEELKQIEMPALLLIGAGDEIYNPKKATDRAQRLMPDLTAEIIPNHLFYFTQHGRWTASADHGNGLSG
ncbi:MAG: alpha/beta hydrolase [Deltaproteobacteria bacterium]|nr:alpha/beta hydrolase [Deltaproteobacteria bacterium]